MGQAYTCKLIKTRNQLPDKTRTEYDTKLHFFKRANILARKT